MSIYVTSSNDDNQPYQPLDDDAQGPFFSCDGKKDNPHFHPVKQHPKIDLERKGMFGDQDNSLLAAQLHVPGYDSHDVYSKSQFTDLPQYHVATGWAIADPRTNSHMSEYVASKKYPESTDNDEALNMWKEECNALHGPGAFIKNKTLNKQSHYGTIYEFHPGMEQPEEPEEKEEENQEMPEMEMPEQEEEKPKEDKVEKNPFDLAPGEQAYSILFYPADHSGKTVRPAFSRTKLYEGQSNPSNSRNTLLNYTDKLDMISNLHNYRKSDEDPDIWENLYKNSHKKQEWYRK